MTSAACSLSHFTGAASELTEALIVNPYDLEESSAALQAALRMTAAEQQARMRAMRTLVAEFNVDRWAGRMLADAATVRRQARFQGMLVHSLGCAETNNEAPAHDGGPLGAAQPRASRRMARF